MAAHTTRTPHAQTNAGTMHLHVRVAAGRQVQQDGNTACLAEVGCLLACVFAWYSCMYAVYACLGPGSFGHWHIDAQTIADWGVDFVKMDHCTANKSIPDVELYGNMSAALNATGQYRMQIISKLYYTW